MNTRRLPTYRGLVALSGKDSAMRIRAINAGVVPWCNALDVGVSVLSVGDFAHFVDHGDGFMIYTTEDDHVTCRFGLVCMVIATDRTIGSVVVDSRRVELKFNPDSHARSKWRKNPYLPPDKHKVRKYGFLDLFAATFEDENLAVAELEDCTSYIFRPDLSIPTLNPVEGYVYLFRRPDLHKIGKTTDLERRRKELERQHGVALTLLHSFRSRDYTRAEGELLAKYRLKLREGAEWFDLEPEDVRFICSITDYGMD